MDVRFLCLQGGKQYFEVVREGEAIFVGTRPECERFLRIHEEKVAHAQEEARRTPRARPNPVHTYRVSGLRA